MDHNIPTIDQHLPIKDALSRNQIKMDKGTLFDPDVVDAFLNVEDQVIDINNKYQDQKGNCHYDNHSRRYQTDLID